MESALLLCSPPPALANQPGLKDLINEFILEMLVTSNCLSFFIFAHNFCILAGEFLGLQSFYRAALNHGCTLELAGEL